MAASCPRNKIEVREPSNGPQFESNRVSSDRNGTSSKGGLTPASHDIEAGAAVTSVGDATIDNPQGSLSLTSNGHTSKNAIAVHTGPRCQSKLERRRMRKTHPRPSKLSQEYLGHGRDEPGATNSQYQDGQAGQHFQHRSTTSGTPSCDGDNRHYVPSLENTMFLGYHKESNERAKTLQDNASWQHDEPRSWPSSPIEQDMLRLSQSSPATSIANRCSHIHTPSSNTGIPVFPVHNFPRPTLPRTTSSHLTGPSSLQAQGNPSHRNNAHMHLSSYSPIQPIISSITTSPRRKQLSTSIDITDTTLSHQSSSSMSPSMRQNTMNQPSLPRKRSRAMTQSDVSPVGNSFGTDPVGFQDSTKFIFTQQDLDHIEVLVAAMNDMSATEDNDGMIKSWNKMRMLKAAKVNRVCEEMLVCT